MKSIFNSVWWLASYRIRALTFIFTLQDLNTFLDPLTPLFCRSHLRMASYRKQYSRWWPSFSWRAFCILGQTPCSGHTTGRGRKSQHLFSPEKKIKKTFITKRVGNLCFIIKLPCGSRRRNYLLPRV